MTSNRTQHGKMVSEKPQGFDRGKNARKKLVCLYDCGQTFRSRDEIEPHGQVCPVKIKVFKELAEMAERKKTSCLATWYKAAGHAAAGSAE